MERSQGHVYMCTRGRSFGDVYMSTGKEMRSCLNILGEAHEVMSRRFLGQGHEVISTCALGKGHEVMSRHVLVVDHSVISTRAHGESYSPHIPGEIIGLTRLLSHKAVYARWNCLFGVNKKELSIAMEFFISVLCLCLLAN